MQKQDATWECNNEMFPNFLFPHKTSNSHNVLLNTAIVIVILAICGFLCFFFGPEKAKKMTPEEENDSTDEEL